MKKTACDSIDHETVLVNKSSVFMISSLMYLGFDRWLSSLVIISEKNVSIIENFDE